MGSQQNVLLLFSDQHKASVLSAEGHADVQTPDLDRLTGEEIPFALMATRESELPEDMAMEAYSKQRTIEFLRGRKENGRRG